MSEEQKDNVNVDIWTKNAEEHGRMGAQLATLTTQVDVLTRAVEKFEDSQKEVRAELIGQIDETNKRIDETNKHIIELYKRIEELKTFMISQFSLSRKELQDKSDKQFKDFQDKSDKQFKEIRTEMRWLTGTMIAFMGLALTAMALFLGN